MRRASADSADQRSDRKKGKLVNGALRRGAGPVATMQIADSLVQSRTSREMVYFCRWGDFIKIGETSQPNRRLLAHRHNVASLGQPFAVLATVHGGKTEEQAVKTYFDAYLKDGANEIFHAADPLIGYIRWLRSQYYVAVGDEPDWKDGLPTAVHVADAAGWLPQPERYLPNPFPLLGSFEFGRRVITGDDYYTPGWLIDKVRAELGGVIDLDPASHAVANRTVKAKDFYDRARDGLSQPWHGIVWLNPPFSAWDRWAGKLLAEWHSGRVQQCMAITAVAALTTRYFRPVLLAADLVMVLSRRVEFEGPHVDPDNSSPAQGHVLLYFGADHARIAEAFRNEGVPLTPRSAPQPDR